MIEIHEVCEPRSARTNITDQDMPFLLSLFGTIYVKVFSFKSCCYIPTTPTKIQ